MQINLGKDKRSRFLPEADPPSAESREEISERCSGEEYLERRKGRGKILFEPRFFPV